MLLKDKMIVAFYIGVKGYNMARATERLGAACQMFESMNDESAELIFMPNFETSSDRVEVLNPKRISDEEYEKVSGMVEDCKNHLKKFKEQYGTVQR